MADQFGLPVTEYADTAFQAELAPKFSYGCAVFLDTDRVNFQKEGFSKEELLAGLAQVLPKNVWQYVVGVPRMAALGRKFVLQGGTQYNMAAVKAQVDYIRERVPNAEVYVHPHSGEAGAIGAAMETLRVVKRRGSSTFIGLDAAIDLQYQTTNNETTTCHFCANNCSRTFIDAFRPDGSTSRYISGFSCEKGTVESKGAMEALVKERRKIMKEFPNLVTYEGLKAFKRVAGVQPMPEAGTQIDDVKVERKFFGSIERTKYARSFRRSSEASAKKRAEWRVGIPRVLNMYSTAPFFRTFFEVLGVRPKNIVFSDPSSEEMFAEGGKYGSVDPCYPSKVAQAHFHQLFFHKHEKTPFDAIFFPILTHVPSFVTDAVDYASCPIVAGTPDVMKAAFTKEQDYFGNRGIEYLAPAFSFAEPTLLKRDMFEAFQDVLGMTEDESDFAVEQALSALDRFDQDIQDKGKAILDQVEYDNKVAILVLGRPYHNDPGLHHGIPDEFQVLGYPILSIRSIPKDREWLQRFYGEDEDVLSVNDVWPENYSANSAQKVWAAKFASRHPNVAILDLSSFKCGHDAPTYGIIDSIVAKSGVPASSLHDIDANKPGGSIKIRVKTYAHSLRLREEHLEDVGERRAELQRRIDKKRLELLRMKQEQLAAHRRADLGLERQIHELAEKVNQYRVEAARSEEDAALPDAVSESLIRLGRKTKDGKVVRV
jgi:predicted nucleotide-binding protein (sugar kinase/HSP70/actin superfamily)